MGKTKKLLTIVILFSVFLIPLASLIPSNLWNIWFTQYLAFIAFAVLGIAISMWRFNKAISIFLLYAFISLLFVSKFSVNAFIVFITILISSISVRAISIIPRKHINTIFTALIVMCILQGVQVGLQYMNIDPFFNSLKDSRLDDTVGFCGSKNQLAFYMSAIAPVAIFMWPFILIIIALGIYCSSTSIAFLSLMFTVSYFIWFKKRKVFYVASVLALILGGVYISTIDKLSSEKFLERYYLWKHTISTVEKEKIYPRYQNVVRVVTCSKWLGYGNGGFSLFNIHSQKDAFMGDMGTRTGRPAHVYEHAHNDYIEFFFDYGRLGVLILLYFIIDLILNFIRCRKTEILIISFGGLVSMGICALNIYTVQNAVSGSLWILMLGIFYGEVRRNGKRSSVV